MSKSFDARWERDCEREPSYRGPTRPVIPLSYAGAVRSYIERREVSRCSVCEKPTAALRCAECQARNAQRVDCECGFLYEGEAHTCKEAA